MAGETNGCHAWGFLGISGGGGGFSETVAVKEHLCHALPDEIDLKHAALIEPLAVGHRAVKIAGLTMDKDMGAVTTLVLGGGPIGFALIIILRAMGVSRIFVSQGSLKRRVQAQQLAGVVINPNEESVPDRCRELTAGQGVDVVFDCAGVQSALNNGMEALTFKGTYVNVALWQVPVSTYLPTYLIINKRSPSLRHLFLRANTNALTSPSLAASYPSGRVVEERDPLRWIYGVRRRGFWRGRTAICGRSVALFSPVQNKNGEDILAD